MMTNQFLRIYHSLPYPLRVAAASAKGYNLRRWRYGRETPGLVESFLARERWSSQQWASWREERLAFVLDRAARRVPYYRDLWQERRRRGDNSSWERLENWPLLEKEQLRKYAPQFVADDCSRDQMLLDSSSGTTGQPVKVWATRDTVRAWYALFEARCRQWNGLDKDQRWAIIGGREVTPISQDTPPFWVWNQPLKQLYLSSYHIAAGLIPHYVDALRKYRVEYILGYTSCLHALGRAMLREGITDLKLKAVLTNAEPVYDYQRETISRAFGCPVRESYGMVEMVAAASECAHGTLHQWPEVSFIEVLADGRPASPGEVGEFVCTSLLNGDMPLIRYRVGDRGALGPKPSACRCGRPMPAIQSLQGRTADVVYSADGRQYSPNSFEAIFDDDYPMEEAQIIQHSLRQVTLKYVPLPAFTSDTASALQAAIRERLGPVAIQMEPVARIPRGPNAKLRTVVSELSEEERLGSMAGTGRASAT